MFSVDSTRLRFFWLKNASSAILVAFTRAEPSVSALALRSLCGILVLRPDAPRVLCEGALSPGVFFGVALVLALPFLSALFALAFAHGRPRLTPAPLSTGTPAHGVGLSARVCLRLCFEPAERERPNLAQSQMLCQYFFLYFSTVACTKHALQLTASNQSQRQTMVCRQNVPRKSSRL